MISAERHRKLFFGASPGERTEVWRNEDLLTSHVFGLLKYLPYESGLGRLFKRLGVSVAPPVNVVFWALKAGTEPDVLLETTELIVLIEAKLHADFGEDQLGREWIYLTKHANGRRRLIVPLTPYVMTPSEILGMVKEDLARLGAAVAPPTESEIRALTWSQLGEAILGDEGLAERHVQAIVDDLRFVLESRGVLARPFEGWPAALRSLPPCPAWYGDSGFNLEAPPSDVRQAWRRGASFY